MPQPGGEWLEVFNKRKPDILQALNDKVKGCEKNYKLFDGFIELRVKDKLSKELMMGGPTIPCVSIVDDKTGEMRFYALKALIDVSY